MILKLKPSNLFYISKPSGLRAGRKLANHRRHERWSRSLLKITVDSRQHNYFVIHARDFSKQYNKSHSVSHMKANPLGGSCMSKGIVVEKM